MDRRTALLALAATVVAPQSARSATRTNWDGLLQPLFAQDNPVTLGHVVPGPNDPLWKQAEAILDSAPADKPINVASYFLNSVPVEFQGAWPEPDPQHLTKANPVIVLFFAATKTKPSGDTTPWCAAFVNWCLGRCGVRGTDSASSQSFVNWGHSVWSATSTTPLARAGCRPGDVLVFQEKSNPDQGHVAFFDSYAFQQPDCVLALGGNQIRKHAHIISKTAFNADGNLKLIAVRRMP